MVNHRLIMVNHALVMMYPIGGVHGHGVPQNDWFVVENPI